MTPPTFAGCLDYCAGAEDYLPAVHGDGKRSIVQQRADAGQFVLAVRLHDGIVEYSVAGV